MKTVFVGFCQGSSFDSLTVFSSIEGTAEEISFEDISYELADASAAARLLKFLERNGFIKIEYLGDKAKNFCESVC